ncbi:hypothetical protein LEP1GSC168_2859 [Leptospira santarosai str. HAI134]|nr:hypothetical protein LEP1GSC168_2859 [Leptospira santarosai str. HAI134]EMO83514.1 hypothetical protein LEP1GSC070_1312 [Leptospira santarosai str. AIM]
MISRKFLKSIFLISIVKKEATFSYKVVVLSRKLTLWIKIYLEK